MTNNDNLWQSGTVADFVKYFNIPNNVKIKCKFNMHDTPGKKAAIILRNNFDDFKGMTAWREAKSTTSNLDHCDYVIALAKDDQYHGIGEQWFFGGVFKVTKITPVVNKGIGYNLTLLPESKSLIKQSLAKHFLIRVNNKNHKSGKIGQNYNRIFNSKMIDTLQMQWHK